MSNLTAHGGSAPTAPHAEDLAEPCTDAPDNTPRNQSEILLLMRFNRLMMERDTLLSACVANRCQASAIPADTKSEAKRAIRENCRKLARNFFERAGEVEAEIQAFVLRIARMNNVGGEAK